MVIITLADVLDNKDLCNSACYAAGLSRSYCEDVFQEVCIKAANGKLHFDETRGVKQSTYIFYVFRNTAADLRRKLHGETSVDPEDVIFGSLTSASQHSRGYKDEDGQFVMREALNRLVVESDERTVELLVRYALLDEDREALAEEFQMQPNNVSVLKSRWWPRLVGIGKAVVREDLDGSLKASPNRLDFLKPYLKWI